MIIKYFKTRVLLGDIITVFSLLFFIFATSFATLSYAETNQKKQASLQKQIDNASSTLKSAKNVSQKLKKNVQYYENKLNTLSRALRKTKTNVNRLTKKLHKSNKEKQVLLKQVEEQKAAIAQQMQALYTMGKDSHLRLILKQNDPSDMSRSFKYFEYLNKHRLKRVELMKGKLSKIERLQANISKDTQALSALQKEQNSQAKLLKLTLKEKNTAFKKQNKIVRSNEKILAKLVKEESKLRDVIKQLSRKEKRERLAREKAKKEAKGKTKQVSITKQKKPVKTVVSAKQPYLPNKAFSSLKGKLVWPVSGSMINSFDSVKNSKQRWKGVFIAAPRGRQVKAVARGTVEFSDNLDGYGHLIIIRHDRNYRSLYAHNQVRYKNVGDIVKRGEVIAAVGNSGGQTRTGLYFRIDKGGKAQNPARWCKK